MARLQEKYKTEIAPALKQELGIKNPMAIPKIEKIVISMGIGGAIQEKTRIPTALKELSMIAGQKPVICKAKKSVSNFKLREGYDIGLKVTLRGKRMYEFLDRLIAVAIPRVRDFRGLNPNSFDGRGNYSMGVTEQTIFPEVDPDKVTFQQGMNITFATSARNDREARELLQRLGLPFRKTDADKAA
ncbi:MAG: 50S ribosomal protein L5 [Phycisphaerales bacterium]|nr:50S ribosomal protein L5 [Phycisphaerales bacterium]MCB9854842.1 50S ribosomal protein L5 [Phycisphaerales bacterium]